MEKFFCSKYHRFALGFARQDDLLSFKVDQGVCTPDCPPWYRGKLYFEALHAENNARQQEKSVNESDPLAADVAMANFVEPVKTLLRTRYAAVGILEEWEKSMVLFDHALELPKMKWSRYGSHGRAKNKGRDVYSDERDELLRTSWTDQRLKRSIWLDLLLYDHAVDVHQEQLREYRLLE